MPKRSHLKRLFWQSYPKGHKIQIKAEFIIKILSKIESTPPSAFFPFIIKLKKKSKKISSVQIFFVILLYKRGLKHLSPQKEYRYGTKQPSFRTYSARQLLSLGSIKLSCPCSQKKEQATVDICSTGKGDFFRLHPLPHNVIASCGTFYTNGQTTAPPCLTI